MAKGQTEEEFEVAGTLDDRSSLNDEMAQLCAKLPIYLVVKVDRAPTDMDTPMDRTPAKRKWNIKWILYVTTNSLSLSSVLGH